MNKKTNKYNLVTNQNNFTKRKAKLKTNISYKRSNIYG